MSGITAPCPNCAWAFHETRERKLPTADRITLIAIAERADRATMRCWPSMALLAEDTGLSVREVFRSVHRLAEAKLLAIGKRARSLEYTLLRDRSSPDRPAEPMTPSHRLNPEPMTPSHTSGPSGPTNDSESEEPMTPSHTNPFTEPKKERRKEEVPSLRSGRAHARARGLPEDWQPDARSIALGLSLGFDQARITFEADSMRDWALNKGQVGRDWDRRFNNWLRTARSRPTHGDLWHRPTTPRQFDPNKLSGAPLAMWNIQQEREALARREQEVRQVAA